MTSLSKVKVSTIKNKEYHDLSCSYDGTSNFGAVFPSFARELMPKGKFSVSIGSKILNAPMPVPTMGEMYINHKHVFVPYVDVCPQYQSFLTAQSYTIPGGDSYVPTQLCKLDLPMLAQYILSYFADFTIYIRKRELDDPTYDEKTEFEPFLFKRGYNQDDLDDAKDIFEALWYPESGSNYFYGKSIVVPVGEAKADTIDFSDALNLMPLAPITRDGYLRGRNNLCGQWLAGDFAFSGDYQMSTSGPFWSFNGNVPIEGIDIATGGEWKPSQGYVDITTADVVSLFGPTSGLTDYAIAFKLKSTGKRLFSILLGLNYQFTPNLEGLVDDVNWLKLLAFYKSWFNIYRPKRQMSFTQTNCYKLIKLMELPDAESVIYPSPYVFADLVKEFIWDLALDPYYYFKQDYYGMSVLTPNADYVETSDTINTFVGSESPTNPNITDGNIYIGSGENPSVTVYTDAANTMSPAIMKIAMGILKHVNKNTIIGKDIAAFIKAHFGISLDTSHDLDKVYLIGEVSENIDISPVMSMAGTDTDELGAYAGRGYGESNDGNEFVFENKNDTHGVWITLTCVIPKSGYTQGIHRENRSLKRLDFPQSDFDALGYEVLARDEVSADYPVCTLRFNPHTYSNFDRKKAFGFVPRQSAFKFGQNVVAGELALRSGKSQFSGYHLNRVIPYERLSYATLYDDEGNAKIFNTINAPGYVPNVVHDEFRKIDPTDRLGNFNRVFYDESVNSDHFIVHFGFKVDAWLPLLSMSDSFDTYQDNTDSVKMVHS